MSGLHQDISGRALELLPEWEQTFLTEERKNIPVYCDYPDLHLAAQWEDPSLLPFYETYCKMENGLCVPHGPVDSDWICAAFSNSCADPEKTCIVLRYYFKRVLEFLRKRERMHCSRFLGVLGHFLQDSVIPVHTVNNSMIHQLFPEQGDRSMPIHTLGDHWPFDPGKVTGPVRLMGRTVEEALFHTTEAIMSRLEENMASIVPFFQSIRSGNKEECDRISQEYNACAVTLTASVWHTLFSLAFEQRTSDEVHSFRVGRPLTESAMIRSCSPKYDRKQFIDRGIKFYPTLYPESDCCRSCLATGPYPFEPVVGCVYDGKGNLTAPVLKIKGERHSSSNAIASSAYGIASYRVPGTIFRELDVYAGIHADSVSNKEVTFAVWCHEAADPVLAMGKCSRDQEVLHFKITLPEECRTLSLLSADGDENLSAVWMDPVLKYRN